MALEPCDVITTGTPPGRHRGEAVRVAEGWFWKIVSRNHN